MVAPAATDLPTPIGIAGQYFNTQRSGINIDENKTRQRKNREP